MNIKRQQIKNLMLPIAMFGGAVFYKWMGYLSSLSPYLIFMMLFITYCKLKISDIKPGKEHIILISVQMAIAFFMYFIISPLNHTVSEGVFICVFIPTATAAPVITAMLGGSISFVATYSLLCNALIAIGGPFILAAIGDHPEISFMRSTLIISSKVFPLILGPLAVAMLLRYVFPKIHAKIESHQSISFYLWAFSLFIIVGSCVSFTINTWDNDLLWVVVSLALGALVVCLGQFAIGRKIGKRFGDAVSGGQSLGQKNTVLAVWIALTYMNPIASIAPAAYIAWQNIVNSWQLVRHSSGVKND
ncbi:MAG: transporter [Muribaculaceae bacterium]|nr:transporter [Muribaculaceae bacterium]